MDSPYAVDLFSGAGGFTLRLKRSGLPVAIDVDSERNAARTYRRNHPEVHLLERCVTEVTPAGMLLDPEHSPLLIAAGPPCQGYSIARKRDATDPRNDLFLEVLRLAAAVRPPFVAIENVPGMKWVGEVRFADRICRSLRDMGYHIERPYLLKAEHYGVPQKRRRLFFLAQREDLGLGPAAHAPPARLSTPIPTPGPYCGGCPRGVA